MEIAVKIYGGRESLLKVVIEVRMGTDGREMELIFKLAVYTKIDFDKYCSIVESLLELRL